MSYLIEDITQTLKAARRAKALSQRDLSTRSGLTQANISKIENAAVDIKLSSLIELARALDLEITLVPRQAISAVRSLSRLKSVSNTPVDVIKIIQSLQMVGEALSKARPNDQEKIGRIGKIAHDFSKFQLKPEEIKKLSSIRSQLRKTNRLAQLEKDRDEGPATETGTKISALEKQLRQLRNTIAHDEQRGISGAPRPAYLLDAEELDD
jgi:transcriptional regulator with XRE-family HTH domain